MLAAAGLPLDTVPAEVDERTLEASLAADGASPSEIAAHLARAKAQAVSRRLPGRLVLGADQVLSLDEERFTKPVDLEAARRQFGRLSGRGHRLHSAGALVRDGVVVDEMVTTATLRMRNLSADFLDRYLAAAGQHVSISVGGYQLEGLGVQLFESIEGDHFTVLGLPLLPLLASLRRLGLLAA